MSSWDSSQLMERVANKENLRHAWKRVRSNKGSPGPDGITIEDTQASLEEVLDRLARALRDGRYRPGPVRKVEIPKANGGKRTLGIPNVIDRLAQQAVLQQLTPIFDPIFSNSSHGFRPGRSQHGALKEALGHLRGGFVHVVNIDLAKFFDTVQHDVLMARVARRVDDKSVLRLIGRFLRAGVMEGGLASPRIKGTPQGGPLSPLLSNILLDDLDKELEARGHRFVRYADDFLVFKRRERSAQRTKTTVTRFLAKRLKLTVNETKSSVTTPNDLIYLGYAFYVTDDGIDLTASEEAQKRLMAKLRAEFQRKGRGRSMKKTVDRLNRIVRGWFHYFRLGVNYLRFRRIDQWMRRRVRVLQLRFWGRSLRARRNGVRRLGGDVALQQAVIGLRSGPWALGAHPTMQRLMPTAYIHNELGLFSLLKAWKNDGKR